MVSPVTDGHTTLTEVRDMSTTYGPYWPRCTMPLDGEHLDRPAVAEVRRLISSDFACVECIALAGTSETVVMLGTVGR